MKNIWFACMMILTAGGALHASPVFTLNPSDGAVTGVAGTDTGWGFTLTSDTELYLSTFVSYLIDQSNPSLGTYTDFIGLNGGPDDGVLLPNSPAWTQIFDDISSGVGAFSIAAGEPIGATDTGILEVQYGLYSQNPNSCGTCTVGVETFDVPFSVTVVAPAFSGAPEPSSWWLLMLGLGSIGLGRLRAGSGKA